MWATRRRLPECERRLYVRRGRLELQGQRWDLLVVAIDELRRAIVKLLRNKRKTRLRSHSDNLKGRSSGVILVVASQFANVDTIEMR